MHTSTPSADGQGFYASAAAYRAAIVGGSKGGGAAAEPAAPPAAAAAASSSYLEQSRIPVTSRLIACSNGCKSRFCESCCLPLGIKLKRRLIPVLQTFRRVMMLTLTIDPQHFAGPIEAFEHVKKARCLGVTMQALRRAGVLLSERWFAVIEWQDNGWPHWHVLVEAEHIPFDTLAAAWNVNLAKLGKTATETRTGFGSVRFNAPLKDGKHAAGYACAYLTKHPKNGYPQWVLDSLTRKVHRYSASRGFWSAEPATANADEEQHDQDDEQQKQESEDEQTDDTEPRVRRTIAEQLATCGETTVILRETDCADPVPGELTRRHDFVVKLFEPLSQVLSRYEYSDLNKAGTRAELLVDDLANLHQRSGHNANANRELPASLRLQLHTQPL